MQIGIVIALTTAVMLMELHSCTAQCKPNYWADGCSHVVDFKFTDDCNKHDICYACGNGLGVSRHNCDDRWYNNMKNTCASVNWFLRAGCRFVAWTYYSWMRNWGEKSYKAPSLGFCNENWVPACV